MKIAIIGAAGVRTPNIVQSIIDRQTRLALYELALMDIDSDHLELIGALTSRLEQTQATRFRIIRTTDPKTALSGADFVISTFRVGVIESRVIDERVPLDLGLLGQETTGAGGFAMGIRSIPVLLSYVKLMQEVCPHAWLINFANPAGMLTESVTRCTGWKQVIGICDAPSSMQRVIAAALGAEVSQVQLNYFGLNHLGWIGGINYQGQEKLPEILDLINKIGQVPGLPFDLELINSLGMIPNEYLYYYYYADHAIRHILEAGETRGEQILNLNHQLFTQLKQKYAHHDFDKMQTAYLAAMNTRSSTYMEKETRISHPAQPNYLGIFDTIADPGYAGVALDLIEALIGSKPSTQILNVANQGSIQGMDPDDIVEIPVRVEQNCIQPMAAGKIPDHCLGLMKQVKYFERLTIEAAVENSYQKALLALTLHPLVRDFSNAKTILDNYILRHMGNFPALR